MMEDICFRPDKFPKSMYQESLQNRVLLALGSVAHKLSKAGQVERAVQIVDKVHIMLGLHGLYNYAASSVLFFVENL